MKDKLIAKLKELNVKQNRFVEYLHTAVEFGEDADWEEVFDHKLTKIKRLESEIASLESDVEKEKQVSNNTGLPCKCGNKIFTHRHTNWIECTVCNKILILTDK